MTITEKINKEINLGDIYICLRLRLGEKEQVLSNMPEAFKELYYQGGYFKKEDTFDFTASNPSRICYPNSIGEYNSSYIHDMEAFGFYNLFSFALSEQDRELVCIVSAPWEPYDNKKHWLVYQNLVLDSVCKIITKFSEFPSLANMDFTVLRESCIA